MGTGAVLADKELYYFWPAIVWVPVLSGANHDLRDR